MSSEGVSMEVAPEELLPPRPLAVTIKVIDTFGEWVGNTLAWLVIPLMAGLVIEVFSRYLFNNPMVWVYEMTFMIYGGMFMLGASYTLLKKMHIRTDIFYERFTVRWQGIVDGTLFVVIFFPGLSFPLRCVMGPGHAFLSSQGGLGGQPLGASPMAHEDGYPHRHRPVTGPGVFGVAEVLVGH